MGQLTELREQKADGTTSAVYTYGYDDNGNITRVDEWMSGFGVSYTYDTQNQLQREQYNDGTTITYTYDELGNRTSVNRNGVVTNYGYNTEKNRLTSVGENTYTYDNAGNLTGDGTKLKECDKKLSIDTLTLSMDIAIYFAEVFIRNFSNIEWGFVTKPKTLAYVNRPVLVGFSSKVELDPRNILFNLTLKASNGNVDPNALYEMFNVWKNDV